MTAKRPILTRTLPTIGVLLTFALVVSCSSKGNDSDNPVEEARYPAVKAILADAMPQICACLGDALKAQYDTDTALIPGIEWPIDLLAHRRSLDMNLADTSTSWRVVYSLTIPAQLTSVSYVWDLGRYDSSGTIPHLSPRAPTRIEHNLDYAHTVGSGNTALKWIINIHVTLRDLDKDTASVSASVKVTYQDNVTCDGLCEDYTIALTDGRLTKVDGEFDVSALRDELTATLKRTEPGAIIGVTAHFTWHVDGMIASGGHVSLRVVNGDFSKTDDYTLCP